MNKFEIIREWGTQLQIPWCDELEPESVNRKPVSKRWERSLANGKAE